MSTGRLPQSSGSNTPVANHGATVLPTDNQSPSTGQSATRAPETRSETAAQIDLGKTILLIESVAKTKDRNQAMVAIVNHATAQFPGSTVRCGIGATRLRRYYDNRLGWLGPASDLFQEAAEKWDDDSATLPTSTTDPNELQPQQQPKNKDLVRFNIDDEVGLGRCVLWINDAKLSASDRGWLRRALPSLRAILWLRGGGAIGQLARWMSGGGTVARVYLGLATLLVFLLIIWPVSYRVRCTTLVRPKHSRIIAAPFDATLEETHVEPGDSVKLGDVLISLDGRPLRLELETIGAQIAQVQKERDIAMVGGKVAEGQQAKLRIRELSRQRDLRLAA